MGNKVVILKTKIMDASLRLYMYFLEQQGVKVIDETNLMKGGDLSFFRDILQAILSTIIVIVTILIMVKDSSPEEVNETLDNVIINPGRELDNLIHNHSAELELGIKLIKQQEKRNTRNILSPALETIRNRQKYSSAISELNNKKNFEDILGPALEKISIRQKHSAAIKEIIEAYVRAGNAFANYDVRFDNTEVVKRLTLYREEKLNTPSLVSDNFGFDDVYGPKKSISPLSNATSSVLARRTLTETPAYSDEISEETSYGDIYKSKPVQSMYSNRLKQRRLRTLTETPTETPNEGDDELVGMAPEDVHEGGSKTRRQRRKKVVSKRKRGGSKKQQKRRSNKRR